MGLLGEITNTTVLRIALCTIFVALIGACASDHYEKDANALAGARIAALKAQSLLKPDGSPSSPYEYYELAKRSTRVGASQGAKIGGATGCVAGGLAGGAVAAQGGAGLGCIVVGAAVGLPTAAVGGMVGLFLGFSDRLVSEHSKEAVVEAQANVVAVLQEIQNNHELEKRFIKNINSNYESIEIAPLDRVASPDREIIITLDEFKLSYTEIVNPQVTRDIAISVCVIDRGTKQFTYLKSLHYESEKADYFKLAANKGNLLRQTLARDIGELSDALSQDLVQSQGSRYGNVRIRPTEAKPQICNLTETEFAAFTPASHSRPINYDLDRVEITQTIEDFYDLQGYELDYPNSNNGARLLTFEALSVSGIEGDIIKVKARYSAEKIWDGAVHTRTRHFTLRKEKGVYNVIAMERSRSVNEELNNSLSTITPSPSVMLAHYA